MTLPLTMAVDIGNHRLKVYQVDGEVNVATPTELRLVQCLRRNEPLQALARCVGSSPVRWIIASVHQQRADELTAWIMARATGDRVLPVTYREIPLEIAVAAPECVGIDRLCAAAAAITITPGRPAIVVDAGTAITVDAVGAEGVFLGGTIALGLHGAWQQLARVGSALPALQEVLPAAGITPLGTSTEQAIFSGVLLSAAGGINELVQLLQLRLGTTATVHLTGGDAELLEPWLRFPYRRRDDLVALGACLAGQRWLHQPETEYV